MTLRRPTVEGISLPEDFVAYLHARNKTSEILDSPNSLALLVKEYKEWQRRQTT